MALKDIHYKKLYEKVWNKLRQTPPLSGDCGKLCDKKCCSGTEGDGMLLFPYEEVLYTEKDKSWFHLMDSNTILSNGKRIKLLVCNGDCPREFRPLSCRIFPLTPYMNSLGRVEFMLDLRGLGICPLVFNPTNNPLKESFVDKVYHAFPPLLKEDCVVEFIKILSEQYDDSVVFLEKFQQSKLGVIDN